METLEEEQEQEQHINCCSLLHRATYKVGTVTQSHTVKVGLEKVGTDGQSPKPHRNSRLGQHNPLQKMTQKKQPRRLRKLWMDTFVGAGTDHTLPSNNNPFSPIPTPIPLPIPLPIPITTDNPLLVLLLPPSSTRLQ